MTTRLSKIARLPANIREELNTRLHNGQFGRKILPWLNNLPETKDVLAENFEGKSITHQNLSEWRSSGYQDWLFHQQRLTWFARLHEEDTELSAHDGCADTYEAMSRFFLFEIGQAMRDMQKIKNPEARWERLERLTDKFSRLQNAYNWSRRVGLEYDKYNGPETNKPTEPVFEPENEDLIETKEVPQLESPQTLGAPAPASPKLGEGMSRWPVPIDSTELETTPEPEPEKLDLSAIALATAETNSSPSAIASAAAETPKLVNSQTPTKCQPIPTPAPTTLSTNFPQMRPLPIQNSQTQNSKTHKLHSLPIRGRRFVCIEG